MLRLTYAASDLEMLEGLGGWAAEALATEGVQLQLAGPTGAGLPIHKSVLSETMVSGISCGKRIGF